MDDAPTALIGSSSALTPTQLEALSDDERSAYLNGTPEDRAQFEYFYGYATGLAEEERELTNPEIVAYQQASEAIDLLTVCKLLNFRPHTGQQPFVFHFDQERSTRNYCLAPGRRWGKSTIVSVVAIRELLLPFSHTIMVAPVFETARTIFNDVLKHVELLQLPIKSMNRSAFKFELENGARFSANSAQNIESSLGSKCSLIIGEESQSIADFQYIINHYLAPMQLDYGVRDDGTLFARQIVIGTPRGEENHLFDFFTKELETSSWKSFSFPSYSNPLLPKSYFAQMKLELGELLYGQEIEAKFIGSDAGVFFAFDREVNTYRPEDFHTSEHSEFIVGLDAGLRDATTHILVYRDAGVYYVHKAYSEAQKSTEEHYKAFLQAEQGAGDLEIRYADPAAAQWRHDLVSTYDYETYPAKNAVSEGIAHINQLFTVTGANKRPKLLINAELHELIRQITRIGWKESVSKGSKDPFIKDPKKTHWDLIAALRYALYSDSFNNAHVAVSGN